MRQNTSAGCWLLAAAAHLQLPVRDIFADELHVGPMVCVDEDATDIAEVTFIVSALVEPPLSVRAWRGALDHVHDAWCWWRLNWLLLPIHSWTHIHLCTHCSYLRRTSVVSGGWWSVHAARRAARRNAHFFVLCFRPSALFAFGETTKIAR